MAGMFLYNNEAYAKNTKYNLVQIVFGENKMKGPDSEEIKNPGVVISGVLQDEFKFGVKAEWAQVLSLGGWSDTLEKAMLLTGNKMYNAGGITKQYYKGSDYIPISVKFRKFAGPSSSGDVSPLEAVQKLTQACLPANGASIDCYIEKLGATIEDGVNLAKEAFGDFADGAGLVKIIDNFFKRLTGDVGNEICFLRVGNWLSGFFVIKSADFTYSREVAVDGGPYYIDFDVQFETLIIPTKGDIALTGDAAATKTNMFNIGSTPSSRVEIEKQNEG